MGLHGKWHGVLHETMGGNDEANSKPLTWPIWLFALLHESCVGGQMSHVDINVVECVKQHSPHTWFLHAVGGEPQGP